MSNVSRSRWYVVQTHPHAEVKASWHLQRQDFETYLPRFRKKRRHAGRVESIAAPLFPRYLFVSVDLASQRWMSIRSTIGVSRLVCNGDAPAPVPHPVLEALKAREEEDGLIKLDRRPRFSPGDQVSILDGAFRGCHGLYEGMSGEERIAILLELLGRKVRVTVNLDMIAAV